MTTATVTDPLWAFMITSGFILAVGFVIMVVWLTSARRQSAIVLDVRRQNMATRSGVFLPEGYTPKQFIWGSGQQYGLPFVQFIQGIMWQGRPVVTFEYPGRDKNPQEFWTGLYVGDGRTLPSMTVRAVNPQKHNILTSDVTLESETFNEHFHVEFTDNRVGRATVTPLLMEYLLDRHENNVYPSTFILSNNWLFTAAYTVDDPAVQERNAEFLYEVFRLLPDHVLRDHGIDRDVPLDLGTVFDAYFSPNGPPSLPA